MHFGLSIVGVALSLHSNSVHSNFRHFLREVIVPGRRVVVGFHVCHGASDVSSVREVSDDPVCVSNV